jgi:hypothetical protein
MSAAQSISVAILHAWQQSKRRHSVIDAHDAAVWAALAEELVRPERVSGDEAA